MRYLAWLLLIANLGVFVWIINQPAQQVPEYRPMPVPSGVEPLLLLSERASIPEDGESPHQAQQSPVSQNHDTVDNQHVADDTATIDISETPPELPVAEVKPEVQPVCRSVGPLLAESDARAVSVLLSAGGYVPRTRAEKVREPKGYWVYMPAMPAREARRIVAELDANGMKDYFVGKRNYISLGIFSGKDKAQARLDQVRALGLEAVLDQRYRTRNVYWLAIEEHETPLSDSDLWLKIQAQHTDIRIEPASCKQ